ncbi:MAG TPA: hypothetical protein VF503_12125 [Sphingobium sp.]|uniref:phage late control D family protein n=1 Tax=Sphingobium sp. TaxID=1912891 RepID=UPI002ED17AAC
MADLNVPVATPVARTPRGAVKLNGSVVAGWVSWEVDNNAYRAADSFRISFAVGALPTGFGPEWFASQTTIEVEIAANEAPNDPGAYQPTSADLLLVGAVDDIEFDPVEGEIELTGRDLTAKFIDTKTSEHFANQTASQIATTLAARHGLTPVVTATTTKAGAYYELDHVSTTQQQSEWELLSWLALVEDFDVFVRGRELHFQPKKESPDRYIVLWQPPTDERASPVANTTTLNFSRALTIAKGVSVEVHSWNAKQKKAFTSVWPKQTKATKPGQTGEENQVYKYTIAGLTQDQALARAQSIYKQIVAHMMKLSANLPGDRLLDCSKTVEVRGTGTGWDQVYYPDSVRRSMSMTEGYRMSLTGKNVGADFEASGA